jgi:hypothetical protein
MHQRGTERGSILIIAVIGMLILGILSVSFGLLASVESKIGVNYKHQQQARALAEAGLSLARDLVSTAATRTDGFTKWLDGTEPGMVTAHILAGTGATTGRVLDPGQLWARIDNDCETIPAEGGAPALIVPAAVREGANCDVAATRNTLDTNHTAVITAWATVGSGNSIARARARAIVGTDDPWKHVCSSATASSTCTDPINQSGNPTITPSNPGHPNGPKTYNTLPHPQLGCSQIDPTMHGNVAGCTGTRLVITGDATKMNCNGPVPATDSYAGFFDCALTTPCDVAVDACPAPGFHLTSATDRNRDACVRSGDTRALVGGVPMPVATGLGNTFYVPTIGGVCPAFGPTGNPVTGMVFNNYANTTVVPNRPLRQTPNIVVDGVGGNKRIGCTVTGTGACPSANTVGRTLYVMRASATSTASGRMEVRSTGGGDMVVHGTLVVEGGNHPPSAEDCPGSNSDFAPRSNTQIRTALQPATPSPNPNGGKVYGYPLVLLMYDPQQPEPTSTTRQQLCADLGAGGGNTQIDGIVYSSGKVEFNPLTLNGTVVAYDVETQGSATYTYNETYGNAAPPPGFDPTAGASIAILRNSFISCTNYSVNTSASEFPAPSNCN